MEKALLFFLQGIPETSGTIAFSLALARVPLRWGIILAAGTILAIIIFIIRALPITFGLHTVAFLLLSVIFVTKTTYTPPSKSFIVVFASSACFTLLELLNNELFLFLSKLEIQEVMSNTLLWNLVGIPQAILMIIFAVLISKFKKPIQGTWKI